MPSPAALPQTNAFGHSMSLFDCQPATVTSASHAGRERHAGLSARHQPNKNIPFHRDILHLQERLLTRRNQGERQP